MMYDKFSAMSVTGMAFQRILFRNYEIPFPLYIFRIFNLLCMINVDRRGISSNCLFVVVSYFNYYPST